MKKIILSLVVLAFPTLVFAQAPAPAHPNITASSNAAVTTEPGTIVSGKVTWGSKITEEQKKLKPGAVLYIFAKEGPQGPPLAVKRVAQPFSFPYPFVLTNDDVMMKGMKPGKFMKITARISQTGAAMPVAVGDIEGVTPKPVKNGAKDVSVQLDSIK